MKRNNLAQKRVTEKCLIITQFLNRYLRLVLNSGKDEDLRMKTGNLFHSAGPANAKARFPNFLIDRVTMLAIMLAR